MSQARKKDFKKALTLEDGRRKRNEAAVQIRKNKRQESLRKRRMMARSRPASAGAAASKDAAGGLTALADSSASNPASVEQLATYRAACMSEDPVQQYNGTRQVRRLLSRERNPPVNEVIASGLLPRFLSFLTRQDQPKLQFEAAWALTNVASTEHTAVVVDLGVVPYLVQLLRSANPDVREQSLWCLGNIAGDGPAYRDMILRTPDALANLLLNITHAANLSMTRNATWTLSNFCRGKPQPALELVRPAAPVVAQLLKHTDAEVLTDACWSLSYISDGANSRIQAVIETGCVPTLVGLLQHPEHAVSTPALRCIGNIVSGDDSQTQAVIDAGALPVLVQLMNSGRRNLRKESCWTMSNIAAGTPAQMATLLSTPGFIEALFNNMNNGEWSIRKEATWAVSNLTTSGTDAQIRGLAQCGAIEALCGMLAYSDAKILLVAMDSLAAILRVGEQDGHMQYVDKVEELEGLDRIEDLQDHEDDEVYNKAAELVRSFFDAEGEEDDAMQQEGVDTGGVTTFAFGIGAPGGDVSEAAVNPFGGAADPFGAAAAAVNPFALTAQ